MSGDLKLDGSTAGGFILGDVELSAPGFVGSAGQQVSERGTFRSAGTDAAMAEAFHLCNAVQLKEFELNLEKPATVGRDSESVNLKIPLTGAGFVQCLLAEDAEGGLSWHFHKPLPVNTRSFGSVCEYEIPCRADMVQQPGSTRTILGWVNRLLMKVIVFPITDPFFGAAGEFLAGKWEAAKRPYQIRWMQPDDFAKKEARLLDDSGWRRLDGERTLLFVHGTFGTAHTGFGNIPKDSFTNLWNQYDGRVVALNHYSLSHSPQQNVDWFVEQLPTGVKLNFDMITHSRGGLVARQLTEALVNRGHKVGKVVFGATPNRGTPLANADHTTDLLNRYTSIMRFLPSSLATEAMEGLMMLVKAVAHGAFKALPGLAAMHPDGEFIKRLNSPGDISPQTTYYAIAANFEPDRSKKEFGSFFKRMTADQLMDSVFHEAEHDLVVPYRGVYEHNGDPKFPIPEDRILRYERNAGVHHCSIFPPLPTGNILLDWLKAPEQVSDPPTRVSVAKSNHRVALVIGNGQYSTRPLKNPTNDALAVSELFVEMGYEVVQRTDCNRLELIDTLIEFSNRLDGVEVAAFFFAGHGIQFNGENYLLPIDARLDMERHVAGEGVALSYVLQQFETAATKNNLLLLDCCRDNPYKSNFRGGSRGLARVSDNPTGTMISYATAPNKVAADGDGENSPYTEALLEHLAIPGRSVLDMLCKVNNSVAIKTANRQVPWFEANLRNSFSITPDESSGKRNKAGNDDPGVKRVVEKNDVARVVSTLPRSEPIIIDDNSDRDVLIIDDAIATAGPNPKAIDNKAIDTDIVDAEIVDSEVTSSDFVQTPIDIARAPWFRIPESFQQRLIDRLGSTTAVMCGHVQFERQRSQVAKWIRLGCISREIELDGGWTRLKVLPHALFDSGQTKAVRRLLEDQRLTEDLVMSQLHEALAAWMLDDDPDEAIRIVSNWLETAIDPGYEFDEEEVTGHWLLCRLDAHDTSLQFLKRCDERLPSSFRLAHVATILKRIHRDDQAARQKLNDIDAEGYIGTEVGEAWMDLFGDEVRSRDFLEQSVDTDDVGELEFSVHCWVTVLDELEMAKQFLLDCEVANESYQELSRAAGWNSLLEDNERVEEFLRSGESKAEGVEWAECARSWYRLRGDINAAARCAETAEEQVSTTYDYIAVADTWVEIQLGERAEATLLNAREAAGDVQEFVACAAAEVQMYDDSEAAEVCLRSATKLASTANDWADIGREWNSIGNEKKALKSLNAATQEAGREKSTDSWLAVADLAHQMGDSDILVRAMEQARDCSNGDDDDALVEMHEYLLDDE